MAAIQYDLSGRAFAEAIGVDEKAVRKAVVAGKIKHGYNAVKKKFNLEEAKKNQWVQEQFLVKPKAGVNRVKAINKLEKINKKGSEKTENINENKIDDDKDEIDEDLSEYTIEELTKRLKVTSNMPAEKALRYTQIVELAHAKLKLQKDAKVLVAKEDVDKQLFAMARILKQEVEGIAEAVIDDVLASSNRTEAVTIIRKYCNQFLDKYSVELTIND